MRPGEAMHESPAAGEAHSFLPEREFVLACQLINEYAGIKLGPHKRYMVHNRLTRRLRARGMDSFSDYMALVQNDVAGEREAFVNALTTNLTAFFREPHHFELLAARARQHRAAERRPMRVWCSACSTGEEAWSIAMTLREAACPAEIVASDIDTEALDKASAGVYPTERAAALPAERLKAHLLRGVGANDGWVSVRPELRTSVQFMQLNLQSPQWPAMEPFDVVFCRNVVIYFDREAQKRLLNRFATVLRPRGLLVVGHAESFPAGHPAFRACGRTAYDFLPAA
ncbi:methyltransferase domain-containing protein [Caenimonas sedimenti]|uniref:Chemotaxis protein methyltransferase n=2 Tax=Caenimonas sedimenti TaxID=2596921 RepID=A0A562ZPW5_9BURK|nr:methyltransferase domain-containing protein [Caenimonas sedimenti]